MFAKRRLPEQKNNFNEDAVNEALEGRGGSRRISTQCRKFLMLATSGLYRITLIDPPSPAPTSLSLLLPFQLTVLDPSLSQNYGHLCDSSQMPLWNENLCQSCNLEAVVMAAASFTSADLAMCVRGMPKLKRLIYSDEKGERS